MTTKAIIAAIAGGIVAFLLGWLVFGILLDGFYTAHSTQYAGLIQKSPEHAGSHRVQSCLALSVRVNLFKMGKH